MIREYVVKVTDALVSDAFQRFENEWAPEQELIRCKDCKYWRDGYMDYDIHPWLPCMETDTKQDWFCAYGERQEVKLE